MTRVLYDFHPIGYDITGMDFIIMMGLVILFPIILISVLALYKKLIYRVKLKKADLF
jgi:hypothetical protein